MCRTEDTLLVSAATGSIYTLSIGREKCGRASRRHANGAVASGGCVRLRSSIARGWCTRCFQTLVLAGANPRLSQTVSAVLPRRSAHHGAADRRIAPRNNPRRVSTSTKVQLMIKHVIVPSARTSREEPAPLHGWRRLAARSRARRGFRATDFMLKALGTWVETNAGGHARRDAEELALNNDAV